MKKTLKKTIKKFCRVLKNIAIIVIVLIAIWVMIAALKVLVLQAYDAVIQFAICAVMLKAFYIANRDELYDCQ